MAADWKCAIEDAGRPGSRRCTTECPSCERVAQSASPVVVTGVIGLSGAYGAGKDTVYGFAHDWAKLRGQTVRREAFADRMKLSMARLFFPDVELPEAVHWCNLMKDSGEVTFAQRWAHSLPIPWRTFMERFGTEAHRDVFGPDFWIEMALGTHVSDEILIVTDVRFESEAHAIRGRGGQVWEVVRPGTAPAEVTHAAQTRLPNDLVDRVILNQGDLDTLRSHVFRDLDSLVTYP